MRINTNRWNRIRYTLLAPFYDWVTAFPRQRARSIALLDLHAGDRVLVVGSGTGADLAHLPRSVEIVAGDVTPAMVRRTRARARELGCEIRAEVMDGQALPFPDASFDAVVLHLIVAVIPDPKACLREAARVLKPGGRIAIFDKFAPDGARISWWRTLGNLAANLVATDITRQLGPLLRGLPLSVVVREPAMLGSLFEVILLHHDAPAGAENEA